MQTFLAAAGILAHGGPGDAAAVGLLAQLGYDDGRAEAVSHRIAMLRAAASFQRIFSVASPDAPGLTVLGATADDETAVSGAGTTFQEAFEACAGEGVEALSRSVRPGQQVARLAIDAALADAAPDWRRMWEELAPYRRHPAAREGDWVRAVDLSDGRGVWVPADLCLRRPSPARQIDPPWPLSTGCAAAPDRASATLAGLLELIERDAVALWWRGGRRARLLAPNAAAQLAAAALLGRLRGDAAGRHTWLLDITSDLAVPAIAAVACDPDGLGVCCGMAARPTLAAAASRAVVELCQMEAAVRLAQAKQEAGGEAALTATDRRHLCRFTRLRVADCAALHPRAPPAPPCDIAAARPVGALGAVRARLATAGLAPCAVDLTDDTFAIPVVRVMCPGLQPDPSAPPTARLRAAIAAAGDAPAAWADVSVL